MRALVREKLAAIDIRLSDSRRQVGFDSEEACQEENRGKWKERFS
ncbi:hypothetical protein HRUBRA_02737 [Pseudohaliea rubra DSM 19751]|uniref:Uncharacterized protein n=2 Tax=Pseudohaliea TaxID=1341120 RepID=A0A095WVT5_9GAMM|nr:hypothetical protein HRUBRA_02737 [Pseudohaliea rubra DSM 19751]